MRILSKTNALTQEVAEICLALRAMLVGIEAYLIDHSDVSAVGMIQPKGRRAFTALILQPVPGSEPGLPT
jgi:hypothetical protein